MCAPTKVRDEYESEMAGIDREADKERDPAKANEKSAEKRREADLRYPEKVEKITANYAEKAAKFRRP